MSAASQGTRLRAVAEASRRALSGGLPPRYNLPYNATFDRLVKNALRPGMTVLDVGAGRHPTVAVEGRPPRSHYVGLDISEAELAKAGPGAYDDVVVADMTHRVDRLADSFDLALSWQVMEHVKPLDVALENLRSYLRPGGRLIAQMSGKFSAFGIANQLLPAKAGLWVLTRLVGKDPSTVFPAHYHRCWRDALARMLEPWTRFDIIPLYQGAMPYFRFSSVARALYLGYEEWTRSGGHANLASYYVVDATR